MKTIKDVFDHYRAGLKPLYEAPEAEAITLLVISEISNLSKAAIKAFPEQEITPEQSEKFVEILTKLKTGEPVQYILGHTEFYGLPFKVSPAVLIPRPETEELVEWIITSVASCQLAVGSILDIGTGSGCIAISLKKNLPGYQVSSIDISEAAIAIAKENAALNNVDVDFIQGDILSTQKPSTTHHSPSTIHHSPSTIHHSPFTIHHSPFTIIVSNPPYVTLDDKTRMHKNVTDFEPHMALFVPENDPLIFYKAIADFAKEHLSESGLLFFEINESFGEEVIELLEDKGFVNVELRKDLGGRDRMISATYNYISHAELVSAP